MSDDGIGIPDDVVHREPSTLGLKLVDVLAQQLGGTIEMQSEKGSVFSVVFPAQDSAS